MNKGEYFSDEQCHILELLNTVSDPEVSVARVRVLPGVTTRWHFLRGITERYLMLEGQGVAEVGDDLRIEALPGDVITIPAGVWQRITNNGDGELVFLAVCTPRFDPELYVE